MLANDYGALKNKQLPYNYRIRDVIHTAYSHICKFNIP